MTYRVTCGCGVTFTCRSFGELRHRKGQHALRCGKGLTVTNLTAG